MFTKIIISNTCRIDGETRIWTDKHWRGFHGALVVAFVDKDENILHTTTKQVWGVDGKNIPFKDSDITKKWEQKIPCDILKKVVGEAIYHNHNPKDSTLDEIINKTKKGAEAIAPIIEAINTEQNE